MTLATHGLIGALVAEAFPSHPVVGFIAAWCSHFVADAIPHWDYHLGSYRRDPNDPLKNDIVVNSAFAIDIGKICIDIALGLVLATFLNHWLGSTIPTFSILLAAFLGMLPDGFQFLYFKFRCEPFTTIQKFHIFIHARNRKLREWPILGIVLQVSLVVFLICIVRVFLFGA